MGLWVCKSCQWRNDDYRIRCSHCKRGRAAPLVNVSKVMSDLGNVLVTAALPHGGDSQRTMHV